MRIVALGQIKQTLRLYGSTELTLTGFQAFDPGVLCFVTPSTFVEPGAAGGTATEYADFIDNSAFGTYGTD